MIIFQKLFSILSEILLIWDFPNFYNFRILVWCLYALKFIHTHIERISICLALREFSIQWHRKRIWNFLHSSDNSVKAPIFRLSPHYRWQSGKAGRKIFCLLHVTIWHGINAHVCAHTCTLWSNCLWFACTETHFPVQH